jgi:hypothetical protein
LLICAKIGITFGGQLMPHWNKVPVALD